MIHSIKFGYFLKKYAVLALIVVILSLIPGASVFGQSGEEMEVVFFNPDSASQNPVDATNALQTFCNIINKKNGWNMRAYFFKKQKDLERFLDEHKVDYGILSQIYLVENYKERGLVPLASPVRNGETTYRKVIIVKKDKGYRDLMDLKGKTLAATALGDENVPFYNKVVFRGEIDVQKHFKDIKIVDSANSAIMAVLYGQVDAATVTLSSFTIMQDLNPQVQRRLTSIYTSAETPISPICYFKDNIDKSLLPQMKDILFSMHNDPVGRQSMLAFQVEAWEQTSMDDFRETESILKGLSSSSPKPEPTKAPEVKPDVTKPAEPVEVLPEITRVQSYQSDDGKKYIVNTWVVQAKDGIDNNATMLSYRVDKGAEKQIKMAVVGKDKFSAEIPLPAKEASSEPSEITYSVRPGDTLGKIARKYLGSSKKYMLIATYNNIKNPNIIYVDQKLRIKTGETKVTEVNFYVTAKDTKGKTVKSRKQSKFIF